MAWNEPGNGQDPWKKEGDGLNDLDKIVQSWQRRLSGILGGGGGAGAGSSGGYILIVLLVIAWALTGLYRVDEAERGIVQRFGAYMEPERMPGLHWHFPYPIETVDIVNTNEVKDYPFSTEILTADEQYVFIQMVVQYRRNDPVKFSFEVVEPEETLKDVTESALREVLGTSTLIELVTERRDQIAPRTSEILQTTLDNYGAGIEITSISLEKLDYPQAVQAAVDDTQKARNDSERFILEADTYAKDIIPKARGAAARVLQDAEAYRDRVIADAEGDAARFTALLVEYKKAPRVTRDRLYIEAIEEVYANSNKVFVDSQSSGNLLYLPIDKLIGAPSALARQEDPPMNSGKFGMVVVAGLALVLIGLSAFTVNQRERAIKLQVGEVVVDDYEPGLHWKIPFFQNVRKFPKRILTISDRPERIFTAERLALQVDFFVKWKIVNSVDFYTSTGGIQSVANDRLSEIIKNAIVTEFGKRSVQEAISVERAELMRDMLETASAASEQLGVELIDVRVKQVEFPEDVRNAVYQRMREERARVAAERRAQGREIAEERKSTADKERTIILADAYREGQKLRGEGDARAAETYANAYNQDPEFYSFYRSIDAYRKSMGKSGDILVLDPNNEFFRYLNQSGGRQ
jgi:HflK protein